jgi:alkylation response protein AidB-like acyl-CoA dehydrogenase
MVAEGYLSLTDDQRDLLSVVADLVDREVLPAGVQMDRTDEFPESLVATMAGLGLFGLMVDEQHGGIGASFLTYALTVQEISRGSMSVGGILNTHFMVAYLIGTFGTPDQRERLLPLMAAGSPRGAFSLSEPGCGSDVAAIRSTAIRDGDDWLISGTKMWVTNGARAGLVAVLVRTNIGADKPQDNTTTFLVEKPSGFGDIGNGITIPPPIEKMGYRGIETTEIVFEGTRLPSSAVLGGADGIGRGFRQMMDAIEVGRINVAARACGVARRAFELATRYAQQRSAFGKPISGHQATQFALAEMATKIRAAQHLTAAAAVLKDAGDRVDLEAGMAKYFATEACKEVVEAAFRIHGGYGYSKEFEIERLYRDAPMMLIGEGTNEIQKMIIARRLLEQHRL